MTLRTVLLTILALCLAVLASQAQTPGRPEPKELTPVRLNSLAPGKAEVTQFLAADRKGRLFLLRGDTLEVFRLEDELKPIGKLKCIRPPEVAYAAAMDPAGSTWVVSTSIQEVALCDFVEQKRPAGLAGWVSSVTFSATAPLVAVVPFGGRSMDLAGQVEPRVPRVFELDRSTWKPVSWAPLPEVSDPKLGAFTQIKAQTDSLICSGPKDSIWLASWNSYRLEEVSDSERPQHTLVVGSGKVAWEKRSQDEQESGMAEARKRGRDPKGVVPVYPRNVIRSILCGRDGLIYLIVSSDKGIAIDRFSPSMATLERAYLAKVEVSGGPMTAVLTSDEIVFGGRFIEDGLWHISLEALSEASWTPVLGARLDGKPLS